MFKNKSRNSLLFAVLAAALMSPVASLQAEEKQAPPQAQAKQETPVHGGNCDTGGCGGCVYQGSGVYCNLQTNKFPCSTSLTWCDTGCQANR
jgi:hypothetical protein